MRLHELFESQAELDEGWKDWVAENFDDGRVKGKSRPGRVKRSGASCGGSVSNLRQKAKDASGERAKMYHWCANMKSGRAKNESEIVELDEGWKDWISGAAMGAAALGGISQYGHGDPSAPQQRQAQIQPVQAEPAKQADTAKQVPAKQTIAKKELKVNSPVEKELIKHAKSAGIVNDIELAQFLAQVKHESWDFNRLAEKPQPGVKNYFNKKYDPKYAPITAKKLGNKTIGDGEKYHGRGYIQLTGRDNYRMAGNALKLPLLKQPELAADPAIAAKIAVWYWNSRVKPDVEDFSDTAEVTKKINPALKGLGDRVANFRNYIKSIV